MECLKATGYPFNKLSPLEYTKRVAKRFGGDIVVDADTYKGLDEDVAAHCREHGDFKATGRTLLFDSTYGCPVCGKLRRGYTPQRLRRIERSIVKKTRPTRIALVMVEIFGITTYKLGTTYRPCIRSASSPAVS